MMEEALLCYDSIIGCEMTSKNGRAEERGTRTCLAVHDNK